MGATRSTTSGAARAATDDARSTPWWWAGLGRAAATVAAVRDCSLEAVAPAVLDADGLLAFAGRPEGAARAEAICVLTPHAGELAAFLGEETSA